MKEAYCHAIEHKLWLFHAQQSKKNRGERQLFDILLNIHILNFHSIVQVITVCQISFSTVEQVFGLRQKLQFNFSRASNDSHEKENEMIPSSGKMNIKKSYFLSEAWKSYYPLESGPPCLALLHHIKIVTCKQYQNLKVIGQIQLLSCYGQLFFFLDSQDDAQHPSWRGGSS